jgi:hypothetical protein
MSSGKQGDQEADRIQRDANPQFVRGKKGAKNSGVSSAEPRVVTGDEDATFHDNPEEKYPSRRSPERRP